MRTIDLSSIGEIPVFVTRKDDYELQRVYGYTDRKDVAAFPAFYPFMLWVLEDLKLVYKERLRFTEAAAEHIKNSEGAVAAPLPDLPSHGPPMFDHQVKALEFAWTHPRAGLFLDCGLGKTRVAVELIRRLKAAGELKQALVVAPPALVVNWLREIQKYGPDLIVASTTKPDGSPYPIDKRKEIYTNSSPDVWIISYSMVSADLPLIESEIKHTMLVCDESHYLRSPDSQRTHDIMTLAGKAHRRVLLSGTPNLGDPRHLFGQLATLAPFTIGSKAQFEGRHIKKDPNNKHLVLGYTNLDLLSDVVSTVAVRMKKEECLDMNLPDRQIIDIPITLDKETKKFYNEVVSMLDIETPDGLPILAAGAAQRVSRLLQILAGFIYIDMRDPKICQDCTYLDYCEPNRIFPYTAECQMEKKAPPRREYDFKKSGRLEALENLLESICASKDNKVLIWYVFTRERDLIAARIEKLGLTAVFYPSGGQAAIDAINDREDVQIFVGQIGTGVGFTANAANYTIYYNVSWELDHYQQSIDRNHRPGQKRAVTVYRLLAEHTAQQALFASLDAKKTVAETLTDAIYCGTCKSYASCHAARIEPFTRGCKYAATIERKPTKVRQLPEDYEDVF